MPKTLLPPLRELEFGELDAGQEAVISPELLLRGFFDFRDAAFAIAMRRAWVLLGPKGAGKSAVLEHLRLLWADRPDRFVTYWELDSFPVHDVAKIDMGLQEGTARVRAAWEFLLLLRVYESVARDVEKNDSASFEMTAGALRKSGYLDADLSTVVLGLQGVSAGIDVKFFNAGTQFSAGSAALPELPRVLREGLSNIEMSNQHLVALDGLDTFFFEGGAGWQSLSGLVDALASVNRFLMEIGLPISVVAALRSDHFDALNSQNSNKLKDRTVYLDWTQGGIGSQNGLWAIVSRKAAVRRAEVKDVVKQYLGEPMYAPSFPSVAEYLLSYTRLLPRDLIALMGYVKETHPGRSPVSEADAKNAARRYSEEYFVGEVMNNLSGVLSVDDSHKIVAFRDALRAAPSRYFDVSYLVTELDGILGRAQIVGLLRRMFEIGALGISNKGSAGLRNTDFVYRRVTGASFSPRYEFMLHDALTRAWNRHWR